MTLAERYMNDKPVGVASDSAFSGILLFKLHEEDSFDHHAYVVANEINGKRMNFRRQIVEYSGERAYIVKRGRKWYLDEIIRSE
jgi:hypothetical protein